MTVPDDGADEAGCEGGGAGSMYSWPSASATLAGSTASFLAITALAMPSRAWLAR